MNICPICGFEGKFTPFGVVKLRMNARCPNCGSLERKRLMYFVLTRELKLLENVNRKVLHFAPSKGLYDFFKSNNFRYYPKDIDVERYKNSNMEIKQFDLCKNLSSFRHNLFDIILSTHVLEHISCSYVDVLKQFNRILKPNGIHIICVPMQGKHTLEDETFEDYVNSDISRINRFGGKDHYRVFGSQDFQDVLELVFKNVQISNVFNTLTPTEISDYNIDNTTIYISYKTEES